MLSDLGSTKFSLKTSELEEEYIWVLSRCQMSETAKETHATKVYSVSWNRNLCIHDKHTQNEVTMSKEDDTKRK